MMSSVTETPHHAHSTPEENKRQDLLNSKALWYGAEMGGATFFLTSIATYMLNKRSAGFRNYASINGKISVPIISAMFVTSVVTELAIHDTRLYPEKWDGGKPFCTTEKIAPKPSSSSQLGYGKQLLLKIYDYPLVFAGVMSLPLAGNILTTRLAKSHLTLSQALMQTRVFAQFGIISILLSTVSIRAFVEANDHFGCRQVRMTDEDRYARGWAGAAHSTPATMEK